MSLPLLNRLVLLIHFVVVVDVIAEKTICTNLHSRAAPAACYRDG
ncbi:hypothetical protein [Cellvibrio sp. BR]|nr:hypothetical protein [Cellvibrio sp. BR]